MIIGSAGQVRQTTNNKNNNKKLRNYGFENQTRKKWIFIEICFLKKILIIIHIDHILINLFNNINI